MRLSLNWVGEHVDLGGVAPGAIAQELTMRTALIEAVIDQRATLSGVLVGEVLECGPHPGADRLSVCRVEFGGDEPAHVVCGAPNVAAGQKIVYAPVGVTLPNGLKLKKARIRGELSQGMICAEDELGLGAEHDGILVLPPGLEPGMPFGQVPGYCDVVLDIDNKSVTHRPDLWGHYGFARELAAIFGRPLEPLALDTSLGAALGADEGCVAISLEPEAGCSLYLGLPIEGATGRSPDWLRFRLTACGMRPLSLLVDLSNYVMLETGQPTHPFDRDALVGDQIAVRRAVEGERLTTLDGEQRLLTTDDLVIADGGHAVALAGLMGGAPTEVGNGTRRVLLESACFDPLIVRRTSSRLALRTEAVARFEKDLDPGLAETALRRYSLLLSRIDSGARVGPRFGVAGALEAPNRSIRLTPSMVRARLGMDVSTERMAETLGSIGFGVTTDPEGALEVAVPSWRATRDVTIPEDLVEEIGRLVGYDQVPTPTPRGPLVVAERDAEVRLEDALREAFAGPVAATEVFSYSTLADAAFAALGLPGEQAQPRLANALQKDASRLRPSVAPSLLIHMERWLRQREEVRAFEIGRAYRPDDAGHPVERAEAVLLIARRGAGDARDLVRALRGLVDAALIRVGCGDAVYLRSERPSQEPWWHAQRTASLMLGDVQVGRMGAISPEAMGHLDAQGHEAALAVFDVAALVQSARGASRYRPVSRFPESTIDLAWWAPYSLSTAAIIEAIRNSGPRTLVDVEPFDVFRLEDGRSLAFHLVFQAPDRTLTDKDVGRARERIVSAVEELGARLR